MYENEVTKLPASWAEETPEKPRDGHVDDDTPGNEHTTAATVPSSFLEGKSVRTVWGFVPLEYALDWPVFASYDELAGCAAWMGGRIPTLEEARSIYRYVDILRRKEAENQLGKTVPAVNA